MNPNNNNTAPQSRQNGNIYQALPPKMSNDKTTLPEVTFNTGIKSTNASHPTTKLYNEGITTVDIPNDNNVTKRTRLISNQSGDSIESSVPEKKKPEIPDGGYGWVVVFSSVVISLIIDGLSFSFGLINTALLAYFKETPSKTAWVSSLFYAVPLLMGPIWSNMVDRYGCRWMTIIGGVISAIGFGLSAVCNSIEMLYLTFGIICGLGLGITYVTAVVSIAFWFDKNRTFATGVGASGTGIGTFVYAPLTQWLIDLYGWRGATLILSGTMLNLCVCGALMRDPDWLIEENRLESRSQSETTFSNSSICLEEIKKMLDTGATKEAVLDTLVTKNNTEANQQIGDALKKSQKHHRSELHLPTFLSTHELDNMIEVKSSSRRSLRHREDAETPSRENLLLSCAATNTGIVGDAPTDRVSDSEKKAIYLASVETLSPSEKHSVKNSLGSLHSSTDEGYLTQKFSREQNLEQNMAKSRLSLNEYIFSDNKTRRPSNLKTNGRGNSVDILRDDIYSGNMFLQDEAQALIEANVRKHNEAIIAIPEHEAFGKDAAKKPRTDSITGMRRLSKSKRPTYRNNFRHNISIRNSNFLKDMRIHRNSIHYRGAMLNTHRYRLRASSCPSIFRNSMTTIAKAEEETWYDSLVETIKSIFDFSLFLDLRFAIFNFSILLLFIWFIIPYLYLPEYMKVYGYETADSAQLVSIIGIAQTIGMIGLGFIGDRPWLNVNLCYSICMLFCGISVVLMPISIAFYNGLIVLCIVFGFTFASSFSFTPSILVSLVDLDDFTSAYGLVLLVQGIGMLAGPPAAGIIYEITLRWGDTFYVAGIFIAISGVFLYLLEFFKKRP